MSMLIVVSYDDPYKAEEVRLKLRKLQSEHLVDVEEAVVASTDAKGKVKLHAAVNLTPDGVLTDGSWGALIGLILVCPFAGFAVRAATTARSGALADIGISDTFMKDLAGTMAPGSSTLFCPCQTSYARQGARRTDGNRRPGLEDIALPRGRSQTTGCLECVKVQPGRRLFVRRFFVHGRL
jgi:uncharacterized membrane protein